MSFLKRFFGGDAGDPLAPLRRASSQQRWAEVLNLSAGFDGRSLAPEAEQEIAELTALARNRLAEINLQEAEAFLRAGDLAKVRDHLTLAAEFALDGALRQRITEAENQARGGPPVTGPETFADCGDTCISSCSSGAKPGHADAGSSSHGFDFDVRLELVLTGYPPTLVERYLAAPEEFRQAVLLVHESSPEEALAAFAALPETVRNDLYHFELAMLLVGRQRYDEAVTELKAVLALNPDHPLAQESLVQVLCQAGELDEAQARSETLLQQGQGEASFWEGRLAAISALRQDREGALRHGLAAIAAGNRDPETVLLVGTFLELAGQLAQAEQILVLLGSGGCGGTNPIPLAEFWLRHTRCLDQALEAFKGALRQDPTNRRWPLRIAQVYLAKGWRSEGEQLVNQLLGQTDLPQELRDEATVLLTNQVATPK
jgi:tetratricopeptide (TPR) repeat protein